MEHLKDSCWWFGAFEWVKKKGVKQRGKRQRVKDFKAGGPHGMWGECQIDVQGQRGRHEVLNVWRRRRFALALWTHGIHQLSKKAGCELATSWLWYLQLVTLAPTNAQVPNRSRAICMNTINTSITRVHLLLSQTLNPDVLLSLKP